MTQKEIIRVEIEKRYNDSQGMSCLENDAKIKAYGELLSFIDKLPNEIICKGEVVQDIYNRNLYIKCKAPKICKFGDKIKVILLNNDTKRKEHC